MPNWTHALLLLLVAVLLAGCGEGEGSTTSENQSLAASPPDRPSTHEVAAEGVVDEYLQALSFGDEGACRYLTVALMGRIARANEYTRNDPDTWRIHCETHARDLLKHGELALTWGAVTAEQASPATAEVAAAPTVADAEYPEYEEGEPREATAAATYHLERSGGRWRINDITEDSFNEYGGDAIRSPIGTDFGGNLVLIRGCETSDKSYCEPLIEP